MYHQRPRCHLHVIYIMIINGLEAFAGVKIDESDVNSNCKGTSEARKWLGNSYV